MISDSTSTALFIDGDNIPAKYATDIIDHVKILGYGRIKMARVYADMSSTNSNSWRKVSANLGISEVHVNQISRKNSVDLKLCVDMMHMLYTHPKYTHFVICTSDSDFRHALEYIRTENKHIHLMCSKSANAGLKCICDSYTQLEDLDKTKALKKEMEKEDAPLPISDVVSAVQSEIHRILDAENGSMRLDSLSRQIKSVFNYRQYCRTLSQFIKRHYKEEFELVQDPSNKFDMHIRKVDNQKCCPLIE